MKKKYVLIFFILFIPLLLLGIVILFQIQNIKKSFPPLPFFPSPTPSPSATPTLIPTPTEIPFGISLIHYPETISDEDVATFTWQIHGTTATINTTTIYIGSTSSPGIFTAYVSPQETKYGRAIPDFINGEFRIPLQFVGNMKSLTPGTYYFRGYALIHGKHIWSEEKAFSVTSAPRHEIRFIDAPSDIKLHTSVAFTWEVLGPPAQTGYTVVVASTQSSPDLLSPTTTLTMTPYTPIVTDFSQTTSSVPLRFVGNTAFSEPGTYYYRGLAFINGKNIWSEERKIVVSP